MRYEVTCCGRPPITSDCARWRRSGVLTCPRSLCVYHTPELIPAPSHGARVEAEGSTGRTGPSLLPLASTSYLAPRMTNPRVGVVIHMACYDAPSLPRRAYRCKRTRDSYISHSTSSAGQSQAHSQCRRHVLHQDRLALAAPAHRRQWHCRIHSPSRVDCASEAEPHAGQARPFRSHAFDRRGVLRGPAERPRPRGEQG